MKKILLLIPLIPIIIILINSVEAGCYTNNYCHKSISGLCVTTKICGSQSFPGGGVFTEGDYIDLSCDAPGNKLFFGGNTRSTCDFGGCTGSLVSSPFRYFLKSSDSNLFAKCWVTDNTFDFCQDSGCGRVWASKGIKYIGLQFEEPKTPGYDLINNECINVNDNAQFSTLSSCQINIVVPPIVEPPIIPPTDLTFIQRLISEFKDLVSKIKGVFK